ncbi:esterase family protein [Pedobacter sp.]
MREELQKWHSTALGRDMETLVFGHSGLPIILFPTSMGRYYENKDFKLIDAAQNFINEGKVKIYCPDSIDALSWYNKNIHPAERVKNHICYDKFLLGELLPLIQKETGKTKVIMAGCSFGGYHAANFSFRHPWAVSHLFSMSGAFDIKKQLDGFYNDDVYFNNPVDYLPNNINPELWQLKIVLGTSDRDICRADNERLSVILNQKKINHWLDIRTNADHDWPIWRDMFAEYINQL